MTAIHFVSAPGGSAFMHELLRVVAHEVQEVATADGADVEVTLSEGPLPRDPDGAFVVVPHEFFVVLPEESRPHNDELRRTIGFCVEHPGTATFTTTVHTSRQLGARLAISDSTKNALSLFGVSSERFALGYSELWDHWRGASDDRPFDLLYLGTADERRSRLIALEIEELDDADIFLAMPPHEPMVRPRPDFFMDDEKYRMLRRSKLLLNLHRGNSRSLEWVRVLEAMCNGCVVVSETSSDIDPLVPGQHLLMGRPRTLTRIIRTILDDPERLAELRHNAYELLRTELRMTESARRLMEVASALTSGATRPRRAAMAGLRQ